MTALILDDEKQSRALIRQYLQNQFPKIIVEEVAGIEEAKKLITHKTFDIVFLDIQLREGTSFDLLDEGKEIKAQIIFITAHTEYAIKAFKYSAVDYLVKPIDPDEFQAAVQKAIANAGKSTSLNISHLQTRIRETAILNDKLVVPTPEGFLLTSISSILYCKANGNYTEIFLADNKKLISSYTLGHFNELLLPHSFIRIHRSYMVNPHKITAYKRGEGGSVVMSNGDELDVSRANKEVFLQFFKS
ncbi:MAG TPA: LytTR family DNA-binding domain-containing protein [Saprospiraceae bacterium]|nr:LytTR family DNA-binding domain-containing protein [Saprospiraceae bacterium]